MWDGDLRPVSDNISKTSRQTALINSISRTSFSEMNCLRKENNEPVVSGGKHQERISMPKAESKDQKSPLEKYRALDGSQVLYIQKDGMKRQLNIPNGFKEVEKHAIPGCLYAEFQAEDSDQTRLAYWNRGYGGNKLNPQTAYKFKELLAKEPHALTPAEAKDMAPVIANGIMKNEGMFQYKPGALRTEKTADGSTVLVLEADWPDTKMRSHGIFADFDGSGNYVEQVYMIAKSAEFPTQFERAKQAMQSLKWDK